jgi:hypothetical protein
VGDGIPGDHVNDPLAGTHCLQRPTSVASRRMLLPSGLTGLQLSVGCEVQYGEAERAFMAGERVVHDGVG